jgi:hypothetical protein
MERTTASFTPAQGARSRRAPQMRPGMMTDAEINAELKTATGERLEVLLAEREERRVYRASMRAADPS